MRLSYHPSCSKPSHCSFLLNASPTLISILPFFLLFSFFFFFWFVGPCSTFLLYFVQLVVRPTYFGAAGGLADREDEAEQFHGERDARGHATEGARCHHGGVPQWVLTCPHYNRCVGSRPRRPAGVPPPPSRRELCLMLTMCYAPLPSSVPPPSPSAFRCSSLPLPLLRF